MVRLLMNFSWFGWSFGVWYSCFRVENSGRFWVLIYVWILVLEIIKVNNFYDLIYSCWLLSVWWFSKLWLLLRLRVDCWKDCICWLEYLNGLLGCSRSDTSRECYVWWFLDSIYKLIVCAVKIWWWGLWFGVLRTGSWNGREATVLGFASGLVVLC
jgi:hypothetical protein